MNPINNEIEIQVNNLMHQVFEIPLEKLHGGALLYDDLSLDSLDAVDMMVHLEDKLGFKVESEKFLNVRRLGDVYNVVSELVVEQSNNAEAKTSDFIEQILGSTSPGRQTEFG